MMMMKIIVLVKRILLMVTVIMRVLTALVVGCGEGGGDEAVRLKG